MDRNQLLARIDRAWTALEAARSGLTEAQMLRPGVNGDWSVKDLLAHVTTWEEETITHLPTLVAGGRPPRYSVTHGGVNAFNAMMHERKKALDLDRVLRQLADTHRRLVEAVAAVPEELLVHDGPVRRRIRYDTYSHYPEHTEHILRWRERIGA